MQVNLFKLAQAIVKASKDYWTPHGTQVFCGGDDPAPSSAESTASMLQAYTTYLPDLLKVTRQEAMPVAQSNLDVAQQVAPEYAALQDQIYGTSGKNLAAVGRDISRENLLSQAAAEAEALRGPGLELVKAADAAQRQIDPEYYKTREATGNALATLLQGKLTGGEEEAIQRGINRNNVDSGISAPSAQRTVAAAQQYGNAANQKLTQALQMATGAMPAMRSGVDVLQQATGRSGQVNQGQSNFLGVQPEGYGQQAYSTGQGFMNNIASIKQNEMDINAKRRTGLDVANQYIGTALSGCCFIFMEAYHGQMPWFVRMWRDIFAPEDSERREGYIKMSRWVVPKMQENKIYRFLVWNLMVNPMTKFGGWRAAVKGYKYNPFNHAINTFWFNLWKLIGKGAK